MITDMDAHTFDDAAAAYMQLISKQLHTALHILHPHHHFEYIKF